VGAGFVKHFSNPEHAKFGERRYNAEELESSPGREQMRPIRMVTILIALSLALSLVVSGLADPISDARKAMKAIQGAYNKIDAAANAKNVKGFLAYNAPDYAIVDKSDAVRMQNGPDMQAGYAAFFAASLSYKQSTTIQKLSLRDKEAVVTVKQHI